MKMWSHLAAQRGMSDEGSEEDEKEALSRRYGSGTLVLLPLSSGRWATFDPQRQLIALTDELPQEQDLRRWSLEYEARIREGQDRWQKEASRRSAPKPDAEDLGF